MQVCSTDLDMCAVESEQRSRLYVSGGLLGTAEGTGVCELELKVRDMGWSAELPTRWRALAVICIRPESGPSFVPKPQSEAAGVPLI